MFKPTVPPGFKDTESFLKADPKAQMNAMSKMSTTAQINNALAFSSPINNFGKPSLPSTRTLPNMTQPAIQPKPFQPLPIPSNSFSPMNSWQHQQPWQPLPLPSNNFSQLSPMNSWQRQQPLQPQVDFKSWNPESYKPSTAAPLAGVQQNLTSNTTTTTPTLNNHPTSHPYTGWQALADTGKIVTKIACHAAEALPPIAKLPIMGPSLAFSLAANSHANNGANPGKTICDTVAGAVVDTAVAEVSLPAYVALKPASIIGHTLKNHPEFETAAKKRQVENFDAAFKATTFTERRMYLELAEDATSELATQQFCKAAATTEDAAKHFISGVLSGDFFRKTPTTNSTPHSSYTPTGP